MREYNGKINVTKDTMLFVVNSVFENNIKESTTKENILKMMPDIYENEDEEKIIEMLPYRAYKDLERLIEYVKTSDDIKTFFLKREHPDIRFLEEAMIIVLRVKYHDYNYTLNPGVIEKLKGLFSEENKKIAKRYGEIEDLTKGMLYAYGIVDFEFLRKQLCKYMNEIITETELRDIYFTRLNLNLFVNDYSIRWTNTNEIQAFVTYLDEEESPIDIGQIAEEQKARKMKYKQFSKQELLKREEYLHDERAKKLYKFFNTCKKIYFDKQSKIPTFFSPEDLSCQKIYNYKQLFSLSSTINDENIFLFGDEFPFVTRGYVEKIFLIRINKTYIQGEKFIDLLEDKNYEIVLNGNPYFDEGQEYSISIFRNKVPDKY